MGKVYAIRKAGNIENKIVHSWGECERLVKGVKGAKYKSFQSMWEAEDYLKAGSKSLLKSEGKYPKDCLHIYVDGSYDAKSGMASSGIVYVKDDVVIDIGSGRIDPEKGNNMRQVTGELYAVLQAVINSYIEGETKIVIFYDYEGVCSHATGEWKANSPFAEKYQKSIKSYAKIMDITFVKVDSHTGDLYNEIADDVCKSIIGIPSTRKVHNLIQTQELKTNSEEVFSIFDNLGYVAENTKVLFVDKDDEE